MGEVLAFSLSSFLLLPHSSICSRRGHLHFNFGRASLLATSSVCFSSTRSNLYPSSHAKQKQCSWMTLASAVSDSKVPTSFTPDPAGESIDILPDSGGFGDNGGRDIGGGGGGGGSGNDGNDESQSGRSDDQSGGHEKKAGMSMSQKLTLGYAALVGIGGTMGYVKGGSKKSLIAGGFSAFILYCVYTLLPSNPVLASSFGLIISASLLGVMGSRFKKSGKVFPAGVVSLASLVMSGGYLHGIMRSLH